MSRQRTRQQQRAHTHQWAAALQRSHAAFDEIQAVQVRRARNRKIRLLLMVIVGVAVLPMIPRLSQAALFASLCLLDVVGVVYAALRLGGVLGGAK